MDDAGLRLYAIPFACSLAPHIALREAGLAHEISWVSRTALRLHDGGDFRLVNPKGKVAALLLEDGRLVTENVAVLLCIAELGGGRALAPPPEESATRLRLHEWLSFVSTELHKQVLTPYFDPAAPAETKKDVVTRLLPDLLRHPERALATGSFLLGSRLSIADVYLFWTLLLVPQLGVELADYPALVRFRDGLLQRESVAGALAIERRALGRRPPERP